MQPGSRKLWLPSVASQQGAVLLLESIWDEIVHREIHFSSETEMCACIFAFCFLFAVVCSVFLWECLSMPLCYALLYNYKWCFLGNPWPSNFWGTTRLIMPCQLLAGTAEFDLFFNIWRADAIFLWLTYKKHHFMLIQSADRKWVDSVTCCLTWPEMKHLSYDTS